MASHSTNSLKSPVQFIPSISRNTIPPRIWFAILSFPQHHSHFVDILLSTLDYLQLIIQGLLANSTYYNDPKTTPRLADTLLTLGKTMNPGSFMTLSLNNKGSCLGVLLFLTCYSILKFGFLAYIITLCIKRSYGSKNILMIWRWIFKLQRTVVYFLVTSIWSNYFRAGLQNTFKLTSGENVALMLFSAAMVIIEFVFSLVLIIQYSSCIPNRSIMASKNQYIEATSIVQKFTIQVMRNVFLTQIQKLILFSNLFSFLLCLLRNLYYFIYFPHYKLKAALHHSTMLISVSSLYLAYLVHYIMKLNYDTKLNSSFGLILWIILMVPLISLYRKFVKNVWSNLILKSGTENKNMVLHRIIAMKDTIKESAAPPMSTDKHSHSYLLGHTVVVQIKRFLGRDDENSQQEFNLKENMEKYMIKYISELLSKYPKDKLIKLYIAFYYARKLTMYGPAMKIVQELKHSSQFNTALTAHLISYSLHSSLKSDYKYKRYKLDLATYVKDISLVTQLKEEIFKQAGFQVDLYENLVKNPQDLGQVHKLAQKVNRRRTVIEKKIQKLLEMIPKYYLEPFVLCAHYYSVLNHATHQYFNYANLYNKGYSKYQKLLLNNNICQENLFHKDTKLLVVSFNKKDGGLVKYMSKGLENILGKNILDYHVAMISEGVLREANYKWTNFVIEQGTKSDYDLLRPSFQYHFKEECFVPCDFYHHVSPFLNQGLFLYVLMRFSPTSNEEFLIIEDNGDIIGFTKLVGQKLGLFQARKKLLANTRMNINELSKDLARANHVMNIVKSQEKSLEQNALGMNDKEVQDLHSLFTSAGQDLTLNSLGESNAGNRQYTYRCKFQNRAYGKGLVRVVVLQRVLNNEASFFSLDESEKDFIDKLEEKSESEDIPVPSEIVAKKIPSSSKDEDVQELDLLKSKGENYLISTDQDNLSTYRKLLSPRNFGENLISPRKSNTLEKYASLKTKQKEIIQTIKREKDAHTSIKTDKNRAPNKLSKDFENAVSSKYYPNSSRVLRLILYVTIIIIFAFQIAFQDSFESDVQVLQARKNVAKLCISRTDLFTTAYGQARSLWIFAVGQQNQSDYQEIARAPSLLNRMEAVLTQLAKVNKGMMIAMDSLDIESRRRLFETNVRIFDARANVTGRSFVNMTTFQAVEKIVETGFRGIALGTNNLVDVIPDFQIILINAMNDLLYESEILARFLNNIVGEQNDVILEKNSGTVIKSFCILIVLFVAFTVAMIKSYKDETQNMSAVARIDIDGIVKIKDRVVEFQAMLQDETSFLELESTEIFPSSNTKTNIISKQFVNPNPKGKYSSSTAQQPHFRGISRKHKWYSLIFFILWFIMGGLILWKYLQTASLTNNLNYILNQLYFIDRSRPRTRLTSLLTIDFVSDSTALVRNKNLTVQYAQEWTFLGNVTHNITDTLKKQDSSYDPIIEGILFENGCNYTSKNDYLIQWCQVMRDHYNKAGLVRFLTEFQSVIGEFMERYQSSDKSQESLVALSLETYNDRVPPMMVIVDLMNIISSQLDKSFSETYAKTKNFNGVGSIVLYICLVIICLLIQIVVFSKISEAENEFRNVLKVFPARLVLSNFMLKSYLIRTWKGTLDSVKLLSREQGEMH